MSELIVSVSGVRGIVGESLTDAVVARFAAAMGDVVRGQPVAVGRDSRPSGELLERAVCSGLISKGSKPIRLGILPTPTFGFAVRDHQAAGGIQITASHNPTAYNGLKLFSSQGMVLTAREGQAFLKQFHGQPEHVQVDAGKEPVDHKLGQQAVERHISEVLRQVDVAAVQGRRFSVYVDANHGAGGQATVALLEALACRITAEATEPTGEFLHDPEPTPENLLAVSPRVREACCDIGFALDPDSDRLAVIDENGVCIGEELTLALAAEYRLRQQPGPVVVNMSTSRVVEDIAKRHGCPCHRSPVGEVQVAEKMMEVDAVIGGEGNGGVIDPRIGFVRDPFIGMAMILNLMTAAGQRVSELVAGLPQYRIVKEKLGVDPASLSELYNRLRAHWPGARTDASDGLRLDMAEHWVHIRPSNTEPIVRIIAEAATVQEARTLCEDVRRVIGKS